MQDPNIDLYQVPQPGVKPWDRPHLSRFSSKEIDEVGFVWQTVWAGSAMVLPFVLPTLKKDRG
jgi:hypothetical protein